MKSTRALMIRLGLAVLVCCSCGKHSQQVFSLPAHFAALQLVAVLPFENFSTDAGAAAVATELFCSELERSGRFKVMNQGEVTRRLQEARLLSEGGTDRSNAARIADVLGVDAVFAGSVLEYVYLHTIRDGVVVGREPVVGLSARLIDRRTGSIVWSAVHSRSTYDLLVSNRDSISMVAESAVHHLIATLPVAQRSERAPPPIGGKP